MLPERKCLICSNSGHCGAFWRVNILPDAVFFGCDRNAHARTSHATPQAAACNLPNLVGMDSQAAEAVLSALGLTQQRTDDLTRRRQGLWFRSSLLPAPG